MEICANINITKKIKRKFEFIINIYVVESKRANHH